MNVIKLNNTEFPVTSYNKSTNFYEGSITSTAYMAIQVSDMAILNALADAPVTSIEIYHENTKIYDTGEVNAHIDNITESMGDDQMFVTVNMTFNIE